MKKFKLFVASVLTYLMAISLLPINLLETVANAAENEYKTLVKSDYYLRAESQYKNKFLIAYGDIDDNQREGKITVSLVSNGNETVLKEIENYKDVQITKSKDDQNIVLIKTFKDYFKESNEDYYEKYNFITNEFSKITKDEWTSLLPKYDNGFKQPQKVEDKDKIENILTMINKETDSQLTIQDKILNENGEKYTNDSEEIRVSIYPDAYLQDILILNVMYYNKVLNEVKYYNGLVYNDYIYVTTKDKYLEYKALNKEKTVYIWEENSDGNYNLIKVEDGKLVFNNKIEIDRYSTHSIKEIEGNLYAQTRNKIFIYEANNSEYKLINEIQTFGNSYTNFDFNIITEIVGDKIYLSKIVNHKTVQEYDITSDIKKLDGSDIYSRLKPFSDGNYMLMSDKGFIIIQKNVPEEPSNPENPSNPETPGDNGNNNNNVVIKPSEDKVVAEISKINPNEKNEIKVNTEASAKKVDVTIKDIESLKNGTGSLNITVNNGVKLNLPLSIIDKNLLEGAKDVTISLDVIENSDILKDIKGVNKVFDFNLVINKEDGSTFVHNFKEGQAEVTLNLTDKDLEGLNKDNIVVYYYNDAEKKFEAMETKVDGNKVTFKTSHFSKYVIAENIESNKDNSSSTDENLTGTNNTTENKNESGKGQLPETGSKVSNSIILVLAIGIVAIGGTMVLRKRRHA